MTESTTILVPIRYPLTAASTRTLREAGRIAREREPAELLAIHVDLFQNNGDTGKRELSHAVAAVLDGVDAGVITRRGFFVEEVILEEAQAVGADVVVVGADGTPRWRRLLRRVLGDDPAVGPYLRRELADDVEIVEVSRASAPSETETEAEA